MKKSPMSAHVTLWVNRLLFALMIILAFLMPLILDFYGARWSMPDVNRWVVCIAYYVCLLLILPALWNIERLLKAVLGGDVFISANVNRLRRIRWLSAGVGVICFPVGYYFTPLYFLSVIMLFLAFAVSVLKDVMAAAVAIREENDLTI